MVDLAEPFRLRAQIAANANARSPQTISTETSRGMELLVQDRMQTRRMALASAWAFREKMDTAQMLSKQLGFPVMPGETPGQAINRLQSMREEEGKKASKDAMTKGYASGTSSLSPEEKASVGPVDLGRMGKAEEDAEKDALEKELQPLLAGSDPRAIVANPDLMGKMGPKAQDRVRRLGVLYDNRDLALGRDTRAGAKDARDVAEKEKDDAAFRLLDEAEDLSAIDPKSLTPNASKERERRLARAATERARATDDARADAFLEMARESAGKKEKSALFSKTMTIIRNSQNGFKSILTGAYDERKWRASNPSLAATLDRLKKEAAESGISLEAEQDTSALKDALKKALGR